jgi:hypothetical protein
MFTNILLVCVPLVILGAFMTIAFYMGFKFGKGDPIINSGEADIITLGEDIENEVLSFEDENADEEEG